MAAARVRAPKARSESVPASAQAKPKQAARRQFEQKDGFSVLAPDPKEHSALRRRQKIADNARPKPKASEMRFEAVADPSAAGASDAERTAARNRWIANMQAKADPIQIRRAAREREEQQREQEREEDDAKRKIFEQRWYEREAKKQAEQQQRTVETNAKAREQWAECELLHSQPAHAEPVMPPEDVDFGAVRRRLALERAGAAVVSTPPAASQRKAQSQTRSGALALSSQLARESQVREAQQTSAVRQDAHSLIVEQDAEFQISLLHDQVEALSQEQSQLMFKAEPLQEALVAASQRRQHADQRLSRYGDNPKIQFERDEAQHEQGQVQAAVLEIKQRLDAVEAELRDKEMMLASASMAGY